jgi:hypothetical protein
MRSWRMSRRHASNLINGKLGNVDAVEAVRLAHEAGAKLVVAERERPGQPYRVLQNGERLSLE